MAIKKIKKALRIISEEGVSAFISAIRRQAEHRRIDREYSEWVAKYDTLTDDRRNKLMAYADALHLKPKVSVVMPVYNVDERYLREALNSILRQIYQNWELCIADDNSPKPHVRRVIDEYIAKDERIKAVFRETNGHISAASNSALELATGEFTALMDHDDLLAEDALFQVVRVINQDPETLFIYSDEDKIDADGQRFRPTFKPDFSPELFESLNMVTHLCVFKTELLREIGGFRTGFEGSQDYDLSLRYVDHIGGSHIVHIPHILYHWRSIPGSVALDLDEKSYAHDNARHALNEHFERRAVKAHATRGVSQTHRTNYVLPQPKPRVELIIDGKDKKHFAAINSVVLEYGNADLRAETNAVGNTSGRFERLNTFAERSVADVLIFVADEATSFSPNFINEIAARALKDGVGAVGAKIVGKNGRILSGGFIFSKDGNLIEANKDRLSNEYGYFMRSAVDQNLSAVSVDCLAIRRDIFVAAGGFDSVVFPDNFAEVDLCQRLIKKGLRVVWTPWAEITTNENEEVGDDLAELNALRSRWSETFSSDPFSNPNLSFGDANNDDGFFASPPRVNRF